MCTWDASFNFNYSFCTYCNYIYTWRGFSFCSFFNPPCSPCHPLYSPLYSLSLTWRPPAVTGTVLPLIRLIADWPYLPHPSPNYPTHPKFPEPQQPNAWQRRHWDHSALTMRNNKKALKIWWDSPFNVACLSAVWYTESFDFPRILPWESLPWRRIICNYMLFSGLYRGMACLSAV